ncbi:MAG: branched-chain amino acid ABC transporter substrate-binding protein [Chloroflexi bacterium]|nr:branched-chain amino acid ABC transporter substrate-binding protein [Chloroflexota bacterium]
MHTLVRRIVPSLIATGALAASLAPGAHIAAAQSYPASIEVGINLPFTGADAADAAIIRDGALMAIDEINAQGGIAGQIKINPVVKDDGTVAAGQYDPAQAATNTKEFVADPNVMAVVGPQMSGSGKAMSPIASAADLTLITPSSTNPDITDPSFASQYRPNGQAIYFRTVTTDAFQGPFMANYAAETLNLKSVYILDDTGAYGEGIANSFEQQATAKGLTVLGHDKLDPKESDYTTVLTKIAALNPDGLYYGGVQQAGEKLAAQAMDLLPNIPKMGGDGMYSVGFIADEPQAAEGWYATIAAPDTIDTPEAADWVAKYQSKYGKAPQDYALTAYDAVLVINDTVGRIVKDGQPITRQNVRDYTQQTNLPTLQGVINFDDNGDLKDKIVSVFQVKDAQYQYVGAAPQS